MAANTNRYGWASVRTITGNPWVATVVGVAVGLFGTFIERSLFAIIPMFIGAGVGGFLYDGEPPRTMALGVVIALLGGSVYLAPFVLVILDGGLLAVFLIISLILLTAFTVIMGAMPAFVGSRSATLVQSLRDSLDEYRRGW